MPSGVMPRALAVAWVVVLSAGEAAAQRLPFSWDVPKVIETVEVPGIMRADGIPVKLRSVKSAERPEVILQHLVDRFEAAGFFIPNKRSQWLKEPQLTALDTERLISYTFVIQPNPDGSTTVVLGEANLALWEQEVLTIAPVHPDAVDVMNTDVEVARTLSYRVPASRSTPDITGFYRKQLAQLGYAETEPNVYRKGPEELLVTVSPPKGGFMAVTVVRRVSTEGNRPPIVE
jgi:hypothetical protein